MSLFVCRSLRSFSVSSVRSPPHSFDDGNPSPSPGPSHDRDQERDDLPAERAPSRDRGRERPARRNKGREFMKFGHPGFVPALDQSNCPPNQTRGWHRNLPVQVSMFLSLFLCFSVCSCFHNIVVRRIE